MSGDSEQPANLPLDTEPNAPPVTPRTPHNQEVIFEFTLGDTSSLDSTDGQLIGVGFLRAEGSVDAEGEIDEGLLDDLPDLESIADHVSTASSGSSSSSSSESSSSGSSSSGTSSGSSSPGSAHRGSSTDTTVEFTMHSEESVVPPAKRQKLDPEPPPQSPQLTVAKDTLTCPICLSIFVDPVILECDTRRHFRDETTPKCEALCCMACAKKFRSGDRRKCLLCLKPWSGKFTPNVFVGKLSDEVVRPCAHGEKGCTFMGDRTGMQAHKKSCGYETTRCPNACLGCRAQIPRRELLKHKATCTYFPCKGRFNGAGCLFVGTLEQIRIHEQTCEIAGSEACMRVVNNLKSFGKISRSAKGPCFGNNNDKSWANKESELHKVGISFAT